MPGDKSVQREALRLARLSYDQALKGVAGQVISGVIALVFVVLALLTSPWWWGNAAIAAFSAGLLMWDLHQSRSRALLLMTASIE